MDVENLKKIVEIMNENDLAEVEIEEGGHRLRLRKTEKHVVAPAPAPAAPPVYAAPQPTPEGGGAAAPAAEGGEAGLHTITAPMVGTFYRSPSPDSDAYVEAGNRVNPETVVCILEAMKVMNEIKAECAGEIVKILVQNAEAVEYGQALMLVRPA